MNIKVAAFTVSEKSSNTGGDSRVAFLNNATTDHLQQVGKQQGQKQTNIRTYMHTFSPNTYGCHNVFLSLAIT